MKPALPKTTLKSGCVNIHNYIGNHTATVVSWPPNLIALAMCAKKDPGICQGLLCQRAGKDIVGTTDYFFIARPDPHTL